MNVKQNETIHNAVNNLQGLTGFKIEFLPALREKEFDGQLFWVNSKQKLLVQIKNEIRTIPETLPDQFKKGNALFVANYIAPTAKKLLKKKGINYLDAAGNCFIHYDDLLIFVEGQKITPLRYKAEGKLWTAPGLKYIWAILQNPALVNDTYRKQAETAGVALGRIGDFINDLKNGAWLAKTSNGWLLENDKILLEKWTDLYPRVLKPKLLIGNFRFARNAIPDKLPKEMLWGGEQAAANTTRFLQPEIYTIYTWADKQDTMKKLQLLPDPNGKVLLYEGFWKRLFDGNELAPPTIVYADLLGTGDSRNLEAAQRIKRL